MELPKFDQATKIWHGVVTPYIFEQKNVAQVSFENMKADLKHVCQISDDSGEIYTYERALKEAVNLAQNLKEKFHIKKGDRVIVFMDYHHYLLPTWLAVTLTGAVLCPFEFTHEILKEDVAALISKCKPSMLITSEGKNFDIFEEVFSDLNFKNAHILTYDNNKPANHELKTLLNGNFDINDFVLPKIDDPDKELFALALSSATTGNIKLINISHKQMLFCMLPEITNVRFTTTMRPGWHTMTVSVYWTCIRNVTHIPRATCTIDQFLLLVDKHEVNVIFTKPKDIFAAVKSETIKKVSLDSLFLVSSSGEHLSTKLEEEMEKYVKNGIIISLYGMTDLGGGLTTINYDKSPAGSCGKVNKNVLMKVVNDKGENVGPNEIGEIYGKLRYAAFAGYYDNEKLTADAQDEENFFKTEDIGYVDENGDVFLVERRKFLISYRGEWINQKDIEQAVYDNVPGCAGVCAVNVDDEDHGEIPVVAVIPDKTRDLNEEEILTAIQGSHKFPFETKVLFFDELPMTISSKYRKHLVRNLILERIQNPRLDYK